MKLKKIKTGYELLEEIIQVKTFKSSMRSNIFPLTTRAMFIINSLNNIGCKYEVDLFDEEGKDINGFSQPKLVNIVVKFDSLNHNPAIVFCAHHDIVNPNSQNCQDNSASVCNLLHLCGIISTKKDLPRPVIVVFTDKEECGGIGAGRMSDKLNEGHYGDFEYVVNLELTGLGSQIWADTENIFGSSWSTSSSVGGDYSYAGLGIDDDEEYQPTTSGGGMSSWGSFGFGKKEATIKKEKPVVAVVKKEVKEKVNEETRLTERIGEILGKDGYHSVNTPFSDACIFRGEKIDSVCVGILPMSEINGRKDTWSLCHDDDDSIDKCNGEDMDKFVQFLEKLI